jgi:fucose permease
MSEKPEAEASPSIGNPRDVQGILAIAVVGGAFVTAAVAIIKGADVTTILNSILPLASVVVGFYFGIKSQQQ